MKKIKLFILSFVVLLFTTILSLNIFAEGEITATLYQQERDITDIRYVTKIENVNEDELVSYDITLYLYNADGTEYAHNTKNYTDFYDVVNGINTEPVNNTYYAVFTLKDLNNSSFVGKRLAASVKVNLTNSRSVTTNNKYWECGAKYAISDVAYAGYEEGCYASFNTINEITDSTKYVAEVRSANSQKFTKLDQELVRINNGKVRVDAVGLAAGNYYLRVYTLVDGVKYTTDELSMTVSAYDRSGYAHFDSCEYVTKGVGAYKNDGTLKDGAIVLYVNDSNKNTVTATIGSKTYTGLVKILNNAKNSSVPIDVRILGTIKTQQWNKIVDETEYGSGSNPSRMTKLDSIFSSVDWTEASNNTNAAGFGTSSSYYRLYENDIISKGIASMSDDAAAGITKLDGLANYVLKDKTASTKTGYCEYDTYFNELEIGSASNITIEGIGEDAGIYQWGFTIKKCKSIEIRNLTFDKYTEDAIGVEGDSSNLGTYGHIWIHHNTFNIGDNHWDLTFESDKAEGDGTTDFKSAHGLTISYCHYVKTHKTALIGSSDSSYQYNITFHHNYYDGCQSRLPYTRRSNIHIYNCYYKNSTGNNMQIYTYAYTFIEGCNFENTNNTFTTNNNGNIKLFNNVLDKKSEVSASDSIIYATSRTQNVNKACNPENNTKDYTDFDQNSSLFYYDDVNHVSKVTYLTDAATAKTDCENYSGALKSSRYIGYVAVDETPSDGGNTSGGGSSSDSNVLSNTTITFSPKVVGSDNTAVASNEHVTVVGSIRRDNNQYTSYTYDGVVYTYGVKSSTTTSISFTVGTNVQIKIITNVANKKIIVNNTDYTTDSNGAVTVTVSGDVTIANKETTNFFAIIIE